MPWVWHPYPKTLIGFIESVEDRIEEIKGTPLPEVSLYLRLFHTVHGEVPATLQEMTQTARKAGRILRMKRYAFQAMGRVRHAIGQAWRAEEMGEPAGWVWSEIYDEVRQSHQRAERAYSEAGKTYHRALKAVSQNEDIIRLHAQECPDCPWDGQTIFPRVLDENS